MKRIILVILSFLTSLFLYSQDNNNGFNIKYVERPIEYEKYSAPDSLGNVKELEFPIIGKLDENLKIPYPVILIHGLAGSSDTWDVFTAYVKNHFGFSYGGRFDFCLNYDLDNSVANLNFYDTPGADLALFTPTLGIGEYYKVNFDVGFNGSFRPNGDYFEVNSNQQAIIKQGRALGYVVYKVLQITGADKVILMGHSMGGLAAREYLQNPGNWQSDGNHHVAKLVTTGTPHGGSNATSYGIGISDVNEKLDATRDLRRSYAISGDNGVYLFGGIESNSVMWNNLFIGYKNIDVNCNGTEGEYITGINQKNLFTDISYSCIIGVCSGCLLGGGSGDNDGIVKAYCADLHNYYNGVDIDQFYYYANGELEIHTDLPKQVFENMQALDEPYEYDLAFAIELDKPYLGFITYQEIGNNEIDHDIYSFSTDNHTSINVKIKNIKTDLIVKVTDKSGHILQQESEVDDNQTIELLCNLAKGDYYLEILGIPTSTSFKYPYHYSLTNVTDIAEYNINDDILVYPNPAQGFIKIKDKSKTSEVTHVKIVSVSGQLLFETEFTDQALISTEMFTGGMYFIKLQRKNSLTIKKVIIHK